jgi:large subunit ribosomal protein L30
MDSGRYRRMTRTLAMAGILKITLTKSMIGRPEKHRRVLRGMGLTRLNQTVARPDTPAIRGMIRKVCHLVKAEENVA